MVTTSAESAPTPFASPSEQAKPPLESLEARTTESNEFLQPSSYEFVSTPVIGESCAAGNDDDSLEMNESVSELTCCSANTTDDSEENSTLTALYKHGVELYKNRQYQSALNIFTQCYQTNPQDSFRKSKHLRNRSAVFMMLSRYEEAVIDCDDALKLDPLLISLHIRKGNALLRMGEWSNAEQSFTRVLELSTSTFSSNLDAETVKMLSKQIDHTKIEAMASLDLLKTLQNAVTELNEAQTNNDWTRTLTICEDILSKSAFHAAQVTKATAFNALSLFEEAKAFIELTTQQAARRHAHPLAVFPCPSLDALRWEEISSPPSVTVCVSEVKNILLCMGAELGAVYVVALKNAPVSRRWSADVMMSVLAVVDELDAALPYEDKSEHGVWHWVVNELKKLRYLIRIKNLADQQFKEKKFAESVNSYDDALKVDTSARIWAAVILSNRALAQMNLGFFKAAVADCNYAISMDAEFSKAYLRRARAHRAMNMIENSVQDFNIYLSCHLTESEFDDITRERNEMINLHCYSDAKANFCAVSGLKYNKISSSPSPVACSDTKKMRLAVLNTGSCFFGETPDTPLVSPIQCMFSMGVSVSRRKGKKVLDSPARLSKHSKSLPLQLLDMDNVSQWDASSVASEEELKHKLSARKKSSSDRERGTVLDCVSLALAFADESESEGKEEGQCDAVDAAEEMSESERENEIDTDAYTEHVIAEEDIYSESESEIEFSFSLCDDERIVLRRNEIERERQTVRDVALAVTEQKKEEEKEQILRESERAAVEYTDHVLRSECERETVESVAIIIVVGEGEEDESQNHMEGTEHSVREEEQTSESESTENAVVVVTEKESERNGDSDNKTESTGHNDVFAIAEKVSENEAERTKYTVAEEDQTSESESTRVVATEEVRELQCEIAEDTDYSITEKEILGNYGNRGMHEDSPLSHSLKPHKLSRRDERNTFFLVLDEFHFESLVRFVVHALLGLTAWARGGCVSREITLFFVSLVVILSRRRVWSFFAAIVGLKVFSIVFIVMSVLKEKTQKWFFKQEKRKRETAEGVATHVVVFKNKMIREINAAMMRQKNMLQSCAFLVTEAETVSQFEKKTETETKIKSNSKTYEDFAFSSTFSLILDELRIESLVDVFVNALLELSSWAFGGRVSREAALLCVSLVPILSRRGVTSFFTAIVGLKIFTFACSVFWLFWRQEERKREKVKSIAHDVAIADVVTETETETETETQRFFSCFSLYISIAMRHMPSIHVERIGELVTNALLVISAWTGGDGVSREIVLLSVSLIAILSRGGVKSFLFAMVGLKIFTTACSAVKKKWSLLCVNNCA